MYEIFTHGTFDVEAGNEQAFVDRSAEFKERLGRVVRQASEFEPTEQVTLVKVADGPVEALSTPEGIEPIHAPA
jgi:hypothetical protein